jgi:hypothetical protein
MTIVVNGRGLVGPSRRSVRACAVHSGHGADIASRHRARPIERDAEHYFRVVSVPDGPMIEEVSAGRRTGSPARSGTGRASSQELRVQEERELLGDLRRRPEAGSTTRAHELFELSWPSSVSPARSAQLGQPSSVSPARSAQLGQPSSVSPARSAQLAQPSSASQASAGPAHAAGRWLARGETAAAR